MKKNIFYTLCLLFLVGNLYSQQTVWVKAGGTGDGSSEANAFGSFSTAFVQINSAGDVLRVVGNVSASGVSLDKNFAYTIEGDAGGSTLTGTAGATRMFTNNTVSMASQNVTFRNIKFTGATGSTGAGGGGVLYSNQANTINFENCRFEGNSLVSTVTTGGGALFITLTTVTITDCLFKENTALSKGGAISLATGANVTLTRCTFYKNSTTSATANINAAALWVVAGAVVNGYNCTFFQNTTGATNQDYGVIRSDGGTTKLYNSLFYDNKLNTNVAAPGDWGSPPSIGSTLTNSLAQKISANVTNTSSTVSPTIALGSSNLTYDDTSGKVRFGLAAVGDVSPIAFGPTTTSTSVAVSADAGAWNCGTRVAPAFTQVAAICSGATLSALPTTSNNGITGTWSPATMNNTTTTTYTFTPAVGQCASSTATMTITVNPTPTTPTISAETATTFCEGGSVTLTSSAASGNQWYKDGVLIGGEINQTYSATASGSYTVIATVTGCSSAASAGTIVTEQVVPSAGTSATLLICAGTSVSASSLYGALGGAKAEGGTWSATTGGAGTYTYTQAAVSPCTTDNTATVTVTEQPAAASAGTNGTLSVCAGTTLTEAELFAAITGEDLGGTWTGPVSGVYTYTQTGTAPCQDNTATVTLTIQAAPNAGTNGTLTVCTGTTPTDAELFAQLGGSPTAGGSWTNVGLVYTYTVAATSPCTTAATATVTLTIQAAPNAGTNGTLTVNAGTIPTNAQLFAQLGGSPTAGGSWTNVGLVYTYTVVAISPCTTAATATVTVTENTVTTWDGTAWSNGAPTASLEAIIAGNYSTGTNGAISAKKLTVNSGVLTVNSGNLTVVNELINNAGATAVVFENNANLIQTGTATNTGAVTVKRNSSTLRLLDYTLWSSPVASQNLLAFSPATVLSRFYTYNTTTNLYNAVPDPANTSFAVGSGYLIRMPNTASPSVDTAYPGVFTGVPNNGSIQVSLINEGAGKRFNLVGNPYPSPISMTQLVSDNSANMNGTLYFWRKRNGVAGGAYCTWNNGTFVTNNNGQVVNPNGIIQTGQGFIVEAKNTATSMTFNNGQRSATNAGQFFKTKQVVENNRIWLNATNATGEFAQMAINYVTGANQGVDDFDAKYFNDSAIALNSVLDTADYAIQGRALPFDGTDEVPLSFKATTAGTYSIAIDHVDGLFAANQDVILKDNATGAETNLKAGAYAFAADAGANSSRFVLKYQKTLSTITDEFTEDSVIISTKKGIIYINSGSSTMSKVQLFDMNGRLVFKKENVNNSETTVDASRFAHQVLIVKITSDDNREVSKKVVH